MSDIGDLLYHIGGDNPTYAFPQPMTPPEQMTSGPQLMTPPEQMRPPRSTDIPVPGKPDKKKQKGIWDRVVGDIGGVPGAAAGFFESIPGSAAQFWNDVGHIGGSIQDAITGGGGGGGGGGKKQPAKPADPTPQNPLLAFLLGKIGALNYGQIQNPSQALIQQLTQDVSGMSPADATKLLGALPGQLGKDVL